MEQTVYVLAFSNPADHKLLGSYLVLYLQPTGEFVVQIRKALGSTMAGELKLQKED